MARQNLKYSAELFASVKIWFNQPAEVRLRVQESKSGLTESERRMLGCLPQECRILDIGCAAGRTVITLGCEGHSVVGIDVSEDLIAEACGIARSRRIQASFAVCEAVNLPFMAGVFDAVLLLKTYCYVPGRKHRIRWLDEICRVVKLGGWLFVSQYVIDDVLRDYAPIREDNRKRFPELVENLEEGDGFSIPMEGSEEVGYVHCFQEEDLLKELESSQFEVVECFRESNISYCALRR